MYILLRHSSLFVCILIIKGFVEFSSNTTGQYYDALINSLITEKLCSECLLNILALEIHSSQLSGSLQTRVRGKAVAE